MGFNVSIPADLADFAREKVASGEFSSIDAVVEEALRLLAQQQDDDAKLAWLRSAWDEAERSGDAGELDFVALRREAYAKLTGEE